MQRVFPALAVAAALAVLPAAGPGQGQLTSLRIPGDIEWKRAQQLPFNPGGFFESVDFKIEDGIAPLDTARWVPLPAIPDSIDSASDFGFADRRLFDAFTRHVSRDRVLARTGVVEEGAVIVEAGGLLLSPKQDFPRTVAAVRLFRAAGIDSLRAMVNLANAVLVPIDPQLRFRNWLRSPTIYETQLTKGQEQALLEALIDADPDNSFRRVDGQNRPVRKRSVVVIMDLTRRFPVGMVRFYPRVEENPLPIAGYKLEVHDGVTVKRGKGERIAERDFLGFGGGAEASAGTVPVFEQLIIDQSNTEDTVAVRFDEPEYLQQFKFRSLTGLDFDIAEFEVFNEGFTPKAVYLGKPLPVDPAGIDAMLRYLGGDLSLRAELDLLQGGTLGRVSWDEEKIGDPSASSAVVSMQTGFTPEPWIPIRLNRNGDAVESGARTPRWWTGAPASPGRGEIVNLGRSAAAGRRPRHLERPIRPGAPRCPHDVPRVQRPGNRTGRQQADPCRGSAADSARSPVLERFPAPDERRAGAASRRASLLPAPGRLHQLRPGRGPPSSATCASSSCCRPCCGRCGRRSFRQRR